MFALFVHPVSMLLRTRWISTIVVLRLLCRFGYFSTTLRPRVTKILKRRETDFSEGRKRRRRDAITRVFASQVAFAAVSDRPSGQAVFRRNTAALRAETRVSILVKRPSEQATIPNRSNPKSPDAAHFFHFSSVFLARMHARTQRLFRLQISSCELIIVPHRIPFKCWSQWASLLVSSSKRP